jgi:hypothetical protein
MNFKITYQADKVKVIAYIEKLTEGKTYSVSISQKREVRTLPQNKLYWLWMRCISDETGNDKDDLHEFFKTKFLGSVPTQVLNEVFDKPRSTTKLNTKQFTNYLDLIQSFASAELGIILPNPEDLYFADFYERYKDFV